MNKKFTKLIAALALLVFMTPSLVAWGQTTGTLNIASYASANSWVNETRYETASVGVVTFTATGGSNTGKYYSTDKTWRFYANENATLTISVPSGYDISSVTPTFTVKDSGTLLYGNSTLTSGTAVSVSGTSVVFSVSQSSGNKGKVFFTEISVTYTSGGPATYTVTYNANDGSTTPATFVDNNGGAGYESGASVTVMDNDINSNNNPSFSKTGYSFGAWSDMQDGTDDDATLYYPDDDELNTFNITENTTLYAQWDVNKYNYTLNVTGDDGEAEAALYVGGNAVGANAQIAYGSEVTVSVLVSDTIHTGGVIIGYIYSVAVKDAEENDVAFNTETESFIMPASAVTVTVTTTEVTYYGITCVSTMEEEASLFANPEYAYEGQTVTLSYLTEPGYNLSSIVITKTADGSATDITPTASGVNFTFTMPAYAVTATATFVSMTYEGSFVKYSGSLTEGDYILVYNNQAMNDTLSNKKYKITSVSATENVITDPSRAIVWHIAPSKTNGYWTILSAATNNYVSGSASSTDVGAVSDTTTPANTNWKVSGTYDFRCKANEGQNTRYLRNNNGVYGNYAASNGGALTLYKYTTLTECTITFDGNGGTYNDESTYTQTVYDGVAANLTANQFTKGSSIFAGWSTTQNGEVEYADGASITVTGSNITLYAQWLTAYTAMVDDEIDGGSVYIVTATGNEEIIEAAAGTEITLTYTPNAGYAFSAWNVYYTDENQQVVPVEVNNNQFTMPAYDVTVSAAFAEATTYSLVTNINDLVSGKHYIIASGANGNIKAMGSQNSSHYRNVVPVSSSNGVIPETENVYEFVINGPEIITKNNQTAMVYTIYDVTGTSGGYLYASSSTDNYMDTQAFNDNNGKWTISIDNTGAATINAQGSNTRNRMRFNSTRFACYGSNTNVNDLPFLYVKNNDTNYEFYKDITAHTDATGAGNTDGWYFIASPINGNLNPTNVNNMLTEEAVAPYSYDLYRLNGNTWENYNNSEHTQGFNIVNGQGYLYANAANTTLRFNGTSVKSYDNNTVTLAQTGWNLIGNPFTFPVAVSAAFSELNNGSAVVNKDANSIINPCVGIAVYGNADDVVTFTKPSEYAPAPGNLNLVLAQQATNRGNAATVDNAIVSFNEGSELGKFYFGTQNANLYIPQGTEEYAIVSSEAQGEMPVNFRANENGTYTLTVNPENVEMNYLHLIDNMTGADIDLLANPSYSFNATTTDYESRFKLVFASNGASTSSASDETFAFYSNGNWVINNAGNATLQVVDLMGRILSSETVNGSVSKTINATPGVYMLRLINGENVKVQKVVIE